MTTATVTEARWNGNPVGDVGERVELARYVVPAGERVVYGQRVNGVVRVTDVPNSGRGRAYLVERGLELDGYDALKALVSDYVSQSQVLADVPMAVSPLKTPCGEALGRPASGTSCRLSQAAAAAAGLRGSDAALPGGGVRAGTKVREFHNIRS